MNMPTYDASRLKTGVVHLGFGAFHRAHQSYYFDRLAAETDCLDFGIACVNLRRDDSAKFAEDTVHLPYVLRSLAFDGAQEDRLIQIHTQAVDWCFQPDQAERLVASPDVHLITITVSEAGYYLDGEGLLDTAHPAIAAEFAGKSSETIFAYLRNGLNARRRIGHLPITIACCDNVRGNGHMLAAAFNAYLEGVSDPQLAEWLAANASFPNSMVDRITPKPPALDRSAWEKAVGHPLGPTIIAEDFVQWVLEDQFAGVVPPLAAVGVTITEDVIPYEETKIRVLNGGHTALTYMGALAGFETFDQAFCADALNTHFSQFEQEEVLSALPKGLPFDAHEYLTTIEQRFQNQHIGDTVERICGDGFAKFPIFIRPTIEGCFEQGRTPVHAIRSIASWVVFARRVYSSALEFNYFEPNEGRLAPLVQSDTLDEFVSSEPLWGDLAIRFPQFKSELERQVAVVEQTWPV